MDVLYVNTSNLRSTKFGLHCNKKPKIVTQSLCHTKTIPEFSLSFIFFSGLNKADAFSGTADN